MSGFHSSKRSPCQKYFEKTKQDGLQKSLSATRFVPFRRSSDTTSDSGSDDFKLEHAEELSSSFSRGSSSESCHSYGATSRSYHCILKDLNEINHLERSPAHSELLQGGSHSQQSSSTANNESLQDFRSRLNCRRKVKTRQVFYPGLEDDRTTDNSCDSATTKAHEDILRSANLLKQAEQTGEQTVAITRSMTRTTDQQQSSNLTKDDSFAVSIGGAAAGTTSTSTSSTTTKKAYLKEVQCTSSTSTSSSTTAASSSFGKRSFATTKKSAEGAGRTSEESILMSEFDKILQIGNDDNKGEQRQQHSGPSTSIARSSTESFLGKSSAGKANKSAASSSPRFRAKTHSQSVLKAATSIPSLIFSNKSLKFQKSSSNIANYSQSAEGSKLVANTPKKTSMDDDFFSISSNSSKTRRSPLRFLGNLVDADKLFRGRWSSAKRAKSTDEITWALANEDLGTANNATSAHMLKDSGRTRKKSLGIMSTNSTSSNNTEDAQDKKRYKSGGEKAKNMGDMICRKLFDEGYHSNKKDSTASASAAVGKSIDLKSRKSSNTSSDLLSISGSSVASLTDHGPFGGVGTSPSYNTSPLHGQAEAKGEVRAETLAEIEAFEELLKNHLQD